MPFSPLKFLLFLLAVAVLIGFIQVGLISIAFDKLGLSPESAYLLLMCTLVGSMINLPLLHLKADRRVYLCAVRPGSRPLPEKSWSSPMSAVLWFRPPFPFT